MTIRKIREAIATDKPAADKDNTKINVFEIRLPMTGNSPTTKVINTSVFENGRRTPNNGNAINKYRLVNAILTSEIFICANTMRLKAQLNRYRHRFKAEERG